MGDSNFYITTTLPYVNAPPHIGFALEIIQADVVARYERLKHKKVIFNTGTDEHGVKIYQKAISEKKDPQKYCDEYAAKFKNLGGALNLSYTHFIRTTDPDHKKAAAQFWRLCKKKGDIYKKNYKVKYCIGCELEKTESELSNNHCPLHPNQNLEIYEEENYFFRFSAYENQLLQLYKERPDFVVPAHKLKEIVAFVKSGLRDFSISRLKSKMPWGIAVPDDPDHVMYVWFDALINYISTLGWPEDEANFKDFWPGIQVAGKDNLRQQAAMWQAMLMSASLPASRQIFIHGFITSEGKKMSKSLGNVIDPFDLVKQYGTDPVRYYLLKEIPHASDGDFSHARMEEIYNSDLANGLGNLVARVQRLCETNEVILDEKELHLIPHIPLLAEKVGNFGIHIEKFEFSLALDAIWKCVRALDEEINREEPWNKPKNKVVPFLKNWAIQINNIAVALKPFLPETADKITSSMQGKIVKIASLFPKI